MATRTLNHPSSLRITQIPRLLARLVGRLWKGGVERHESVPRAMARPDPIPASRSADVQPAPSGSGPLYYRAYTVDVLNPALTARQMMARIQADPNAFAPDELAVYRKTKGKRGRMQVGDEFFIELTGPWDAPVRTIRVDDLSFTFATLEDHMEAGEIRFQIREHSGGWAFEIRSWARSRDAIVDFAYDKLKVAQWGQSEMWTLFSEAVARASGGQQKGDVVIRTERLPSEDLPEELEAPASLL